MTTTPTMRQALERAFIFGQTYWDQADSESYSQNKKSDVTLQRFRAFVEETCAALAEPVQHEPAMSTADRFYGGARGGGKTDKAVQQRIATMRDRVTNNPGGCECRHCGCIFIGGPEHTACAECDAAFTAAMHEDYQRAEFEAEMRRDVFGA